MPRQGVTTYDILLSCPSDVLDLKPIAMECIEQFNRTFGSINNMRLEIKHWSTNGYPKSGAPPQASLNEIFIDNCDACIAIFGTRFGTPTDKADSGTQEEIENMLLTDKQVFLYFDERPTTIHDKDFDQLKKIKDFREKYTDNGIYWVIDSIEEFRKELTNHLTLHFLGVATSQEVLHPKNAPKIEVKIVEPTIEEYSKFTHDFYRDLVIKCKNSINRIQRIKIISEEVPSGEYIFPYFRTNSILEKKYVTFSENDKNLVVHFSKTFDISLTSSFWVLGDLKIDPISIGIRGENLEGSRENKEKYFQLKELVQDVKKITKLNIFLKEVSNYWYLNCYLENTGTAIDENIDVTVKIPKECYILPEQLSEFSNRSVFDVTEFYTELFTQKSTAKITCYRKIYPRDTSDTGKSFIIDNYSNHKEQDDLVQFLKNTIFKYESYRDEAFDILKFNLAEIKHNTAIFFPSVLLFHTRPDFLEFEISSKNSPIIVSSRIEF